ncbi:MAG: glycerate kinase [Bacteroidales bacterium]|nr:glycerate kinase [Bacteroidales bacterium]MDD2204560.1 glycerate kinase [Bacteroidales bacterium]MDD3913501.1 glycerate kinase [Bacteroidales bacterium]MDD4633990.1 glycerate kinase [Bacteroidales bacterium]
MRKIVVIPDSFKECLSSEDVCSIVENVVNMFVSDAEVINVPIADGGEGTASVIIDNLGGCFKTVAVRNPMGTVVDASYGITKDNAAVIEVAAASGLTLVAAAERNPMLASSYGTGQLMMDAFHNGITDFIIALGGSATNDGGLGLLAALGFLFYDYNNHLLEPLPCNLDKISYIDSKDVDAGWQKCNIQVLCDVDNVLCGKNGATAVFGKQKGADEIMAEQLEAGLHNLATVLKKQYKADVKTIKGGGAAGGIGAALNIIMNAQLYMGAEFLLNIVGFDNMLNDASLIITGEGIIDEQTLHGKVPFSVAEHAKAKNVPVIFVAGKITLSVNKLYSIGVVASAQTMHSRMSVEESISQVKDFLPKAVRLALFKWMGITK